MNTRKVWKLAAATVLSTGFVMAGTAQATTYLVSVGQGSNLGNVRHLGSALIPELAQYTNCFGPTGAVVAQCTGTLDIQVPTNWQFMIPSFSTNWDYTNPTLAPIRTNSVGTKVSGSVTIVGGNVTAAVLNQLQTLSYGMFQSWSIDNQNGVVTDLVVNNLVWTYNPVTNTMGHSAAAGQGVCIPSGGNGALFGGASGTQTAGQCGLLAGAVNNGTDNSFFQWDGIPDVPVEIPGSVFVADTQNAIYHSGTGAQIRMNQQPGVTWDLSGFVEGVGGTITALVVGKAFPGATSGGQVGNVNNNGTVVAGLYTLHLVPVPVPAAVWLFGGALAALGIARRRKAATA